MELSPLFFRPKLSTEKVIHFFFFIRKDFDIIIKDFGFYLGTCTLLTLLGPAAMGTFSNTVFPYIPAHILLLFYISPNF